MPYDFFRFLRRPLVESIAAAHLKAAMILLNDLLDAVWRFTPRAGRGDGGFCNAGGRSDDAAGGVSNGVESADCCELEVRLRAIQRPCLTNPRRLTGGG